MRECGGQSRLKYKNFINWLESIRRKYMEDVELKNKVPEIKNYLDGINIRIDT